MATAAGGGAAATVGMADLFGPELLTSEGRRPTEEVLQGKKLVGVLFSAHWCPPCRAFAPVLIEFFNQHMDDGDEDDLMIVFISSDHDQEGFDGYFATMPWVAVPFDNQKVRNDLGRRFKVQAIPTLVLIDPATSEVKASDGRKDVADSDGRTVEVVTRWQQARGRQLSANPNAGGGDGGKCLVL